MEKPKFIEIEKNGNFKFINVSNIAIADLKKSSGDVELILNVNDTNGLPIRIHTNKNLEYLRDVFGII